ncbi:hypothetical protein NFI96_009785 [Prochilodus magdalenae]|nr:hypothetical protein NFI96_009785 [Prochilodus magdalenae]
MKSSDPLVRPYAGAVGPGLLLMQDNARPHVAGVCQQFLQDEGIEAMDWPACSPELNPIEHIWDIMSRSIPQRHIAPQTVQELADALVQNGTHVDKIVGTPRLMKEKPTMLLIVQIHKITSVWNGTFCSAQVASTSTSSYLMHVGNKYYCAMWFYTDFCHFFSANLEDGNPGGKEKVRSRKSEFIEYDSWCRLLCTSDAHASGYTGPPVRSGGGSRTWLCKAICGPAQSLFSPPAARHAAATHQAVLRPHKQQLTSGTIAACTGTPPPASKARHFRVVGPPKDFKMMTYDH